MAISRPLLGNSAQALAWAPKPLTSKYPSWPCLPARLTAIRSVQIAVPFSVSRNFGSLVRWPVPVQRFIVSSLPRLSRRIVWLTRRLPAPPARTARTRRTAVRPSPSAASGFRADPQAPTLQPKPATRPAAATRRTPNPPTPTATARPPPRPARRAGRPAGRFRRDRDPPSAVARGIRGARMRAAGCSTQRTLKCADHERVPYGSTAQEADACDLAPPISAAEFAIRGRRGHLPLDVAVRGEPDCAPVARRLNDESRPADRARLR